MHALSTTLITKSMVKSNTLVYFVTQLDTCLHAEPDKTVSHFIVHIILHHKMVTPVPHAANTLKRLFSTNFTLKCTIQFILIKALRVLKITGET